LLTQRVTFIEYAGVIQVLLNPALDELELAEVHHKAVLVRLVASEGDCERPVVSVHERAMSVVQVLPVGKGNIRIGLLTGEH
jgi:hypothetical protein